MQICIGSGSDEGIHIDSTIGLHLPLVCNGPYYTKDRSLGSTHCPQTLTIPIVSPTQTITHRAHCKQPSYHGANCRTLSICKGWKHLNNDKSGAQTNTSSQTLFILGLVATSPHYVKNCIGNINLMAMRLRS